MKTRTVHKMTNLLVAFFVLFGNLLSGVSPVFAEGESVSASATASDSAPGEGDTITVTIDIDMTAAGSYLLGSYTGILDWDPTVLAYVSHVDATSAGFSGVVNTGNVGTGTIVFNGANSSGATDNIVVLVVTFDVIGAGDAALDLNFSAMSAAESFTDLRPFLGDNITVDEVIVPGETTGVVEVDDGSSYGTATSGDSVNFAHNTGSGENRLMLVGISWNSGSSAHLISSVVFNYGSTGEIAFTEVITQVVNATGSNSGPRYAAIYSSSEEPPQGTPGTVNITFDSDVEYGIVAGAANFKGVNQTTPLGTSAGSAAPDATTTDPNVTLTGLVGNELVFDTMFIGGSQTMTIGADQTPLWEAKPTATTGTASYKQASSSNVTMSWDSESNNWWALAAVAINPASSGPAPTCYALTLTPGVNGSAPVPDLANSPGCVAGEYIEGQVIGLTAIPNEGYIVDEWFGTDNDSSTALTNSVTMPAEARTISVGYQKKPCYQLTLSSGANGGIPSADPVKSATCTEGEGYYFEGEVINLTANPDPGFQVATWNGTDDDGSTALTNVLTMPDTWHTVTVNYGEQPAAVTLDGDITSGSANSVDPVEFTHTTGTGINRLLLVGVSWNSFRSAITIESIAFTPDGGGDPIALGEVITRKQDDNYRYSAIYSLLDPPSGQLGTISIDFSGTVGNGVVYGAANFAGVDLADPLGTPVGASSDDNDNTVTVNLTGLVGDELVFDNIFIGGNPPADFTAGLDQTQLGDWNKVESNTRGAASTEQATGSMVTMSWTSTSTGMWVTAAVPINPMVAGTTYDLTLAVDPAEGGTTDPVVGVHTYAEDSVVDITASPAEGYEFDHWSDGCTGTEPDVCQVTMTGDISVTAHFTEIPEYSLAVSVEGSGDVSLDPTGGTYLEGTTVTLTPSADPCYEFEGWAGADSGDISGSGPYTIVMDGDKSVTANFIPLGVGEACYRVNAGGDTLAALDTSQPDFQALHYGSGGDGLDDIPGLAVSGVTDERSTSDSIAMTNVETYLPMELYQTVLLVGGGAGAVMNFDFNVPNGDYVVLLHMAEHHFTESGARVVDISIEGDLVFDDYDYFDQAGADTAKTESVNVTVIDDVLNIAIENIESDGIVRGIEILMAESETEIESVAVTGIEVPMAQGTPDTEASVTSLPPSGITDPTPEVSWDPDHSLFDYSTTYTASVILTAAEGFIFTDDTTSTVNGHAASNVTLNGDGTLTVEYSFPATEEEPDTEITSLAISNIDVPVAEGSPDLSADVASSPSAGITSGTAAVTWYPNDDPFDYNTVYTASVTLTAADGYIFTGNTEVTVNDQPATGVYFSSTRSTRVIDEGDTVSVDFTFPVTGKITPIISTPPAASDITYGETLEDSELDGGVAEFDSSPVSGSFAWTTGTIAPAVSDSDSTSYNVTFTPTDTENYNIATTEITVTVNKATPNVITDPTASTITYGDTLSISNLTGGEASVDGDFAWTDGGVVPEVSDSNKTFYSITFTPTDTANYNTTTTSITLTVNQATPSITTDPTAYPIFYGDTLADSILTGGAASVDGDFAWTNDTIAPEVSDSDSTPYEVTFTPTDAGNYEIVTTTITLTVNKADQIITVTTPAPSTAAYDSNFTVAATASSGLEVTYSSGSPSICSVLGDTFTMLISSGTCVVQYDQAGNENINAAPQVTEDVTAEKADQTITVTTSAPITAPNGSDFTVAATASSGLDVIYSSGSPSVCTVVGATFTMQSGSGTCIVQYDQAGNDNFSAAPQVTEEVTATQAESGTIIIEKQTTPDGWTGKDFEFTGDATGTIADGEQITVIDMPAGEYHVQEIVPAGWILESIVCDDANSTEDLLNFEADIVLEAGETVTCAFNNVLQLDFGDAPDSYQTLLVSDGARHIIVTGHSLGSLVDAELDGQPTTPANGDDNNNLDDEDGVTFSTSTLTAGDTSAQISVDGGPSGGMLDAWIDFNANGVFDHPSEHLWAGVSQSITAGLPNDLVFTVPGDAVAGLTYARFRLSSAGSLSPDGLALDGEVEDYQVEIVLPHVTVTADSGQTKVYGEDDPTFAYTSSNSFVDFTGSLSRIGAETDEDVGFYDITQGTLAADGYIIDFVSADFEITPKPIDITADPQSKVYGEADPPLTYDYTPALVIGDAFSGALECTGGNNVGDYAIEQGTLALSSNYTLNYTGDDLTITARPIEVTADDVSKIVGQVDPPLTYTITSGSLVFDDEFSGALIRSSGEAIGTYPIIKGTLALNANYDLTVVEGTLTINDYPTVTVTAVSGQSKVYGDDDPIFDFTYEPDDPEVTFTGNLGRTAGEDVDSYAINQGDLAAAFHNIEFVSADFDITPKAINVMADPQSKVYGEDNPDLTYQFTPDLVEGDSFSGALVRDAGENVGDYAISQDSLALGSNYTLNFTGANLTITARPIEVTADDIVKLVNHLDPPLTYSVTDGSLVFDDVIEGALGRESGETPGDYQILNVSLAIDDGNSGDNYHMTFVPGTFTIAEGAEHQVSLEAGWNLVSFNLVPEDPDIEVVLAGILDDVNLVYGWDGGTGSWLRYDPDVGFGNTLTVLDETMGFWINMDTAGTLTVSGVEPISTGIAMFDGWNLVGYPTTDSEALPDALTGVDYNLVMAYHASDTADPWKLFDPTAPEYVNDLASMAPGWGYWIEATAEGTWQIDF